MMRRHKQMRKKWIQFLMPFSFYTWKKKLKQKTSVVTPFYNFVYGNQKFAFNKYLQFLMIIISAVCFISCGPADPEYLELEEIQERGHPLVYKFKVYWNKPNWENFDRRIQFHVEPGPSSIYYFGNTGGIDEGEATASYIFSETNNSGTIYNVKAEFKECSSCTTIIGETNSITIKVDYSKFRIIQLQMTGDNLWPNFIDNEEEIYYYGYNERMKAFGDANTFINIQNIPNLSTQITFYTTQQLLEWTIDNAGGDHTNINGYGLNKDVAIICGVENIPNDITGLNTTLDNLVTGFHMGRTELLPAMAWIRFDKIRLRYPDLWEFVRAVNGTTLHEMGHARGIQGDDPIGGLIPPHGGTNSDKCIMRSPYNVGWFISPVFCYEHLEFLKDITW